VPGKIQTQLAEIIVGFTRLMRADGLGDDAITVLQELSAPPPQPGVFIFGVYGDYKSARRKEIKAIALEQVFWIALHKVEPHQLSSGIFVLDAADGAEQVLFVDPTAKPFLQTASSLKFVEYACIP